MTPLDPDLILAELLDLDPGLRIEDYYSERSIFYNPGGAAPLGVIVASLKDHDGPNDASSGLSRPGIYRLAFQLAPDAYAARFGPPPPRPPRGGVVQLDFEPAATGQLAPHPIYAWMRWVQILAPTPAQFAGLQAELERSLEVVRTKWLRRTPARR